MHELVQAIVVRYDDRPLEHIIGEIMAVPNILEFKYVARGTISVMWGAGTPYSANIAPNNTLVIVGGVKVGVFSAREMEDICAPKSADNAITANDFQTTRLTGHEASSEPGTFY